MVQDASKGRYLAGDGSIWCPELESRATPSRNILNDPCVIAFAATSALVSSSARALLTGSGTAQVRASCKRISVRQVERNTEEQEISTVETQRKAEKDKLLRTHL